MRYPAKVLLFGEHSVFYGSDTLAIPFGHYYGSWEYGDKIDKHLLQLIPALSDEDINTKLFSENVNKHLFFNSNIPLKYGLGSSAALSAAILNKYGVKNYDDNLIIQKSLAKIESHFHGTSSGTDALVSFINKPIFTSDSKVEILDSDPFNNTNIKVALLDSGIKRSAKKYITIFKEKVGQQHIPIDDISKTVNSCIYEVLSAELSIQSIKKLSELQFEYLPEFIPKNIKSFWQEGLKSEKYFTKLCGAGGGGFFLVFSFEDLPQISGDTLITII